MKKGPLVKVEIRPGQYRKMYQADAERLGYLKAQPQAANKMQAPAQNKMREPAEDKEPEPETKPQADDFTAIPGVGQATARALVAHGITTFEALREIGELDYLSEKANQAIHEWREGHGAD